MGYFRFLLENRLFLLAGFLLTFTSSWGQTYFISLFASEIKTSFALTDGQWGGLYTIGTTLSAVTMIWAGALTDRFRVRYLSLGVMLFLALACIGMALVPTVFLLVVVIYQTQGMRRVKGYAKALLQNLCSLLAKEEHVVQSMQLTAKL